MIPTRIAKSLNLTLEVLKGCGYSCPGCTVEKDSAPVNISDADATALVTMAEDLIENDFRLLEFRLGPTDITSSSNWRDVLAHPLIHGLAQHYRALNVSLTMLSDRGLEELAADIDPLMAGKKLSVSIPMALKQTSNQKYLGELRKRILYFKSLFKETDFNRVYANFNLIDDNITHLNEGTYQAAHALDLGVPVFSEFPFPHTRKGMGNLLVLNQLNRDLYTFSEFLKTQVNTKIYRPLIPNVVDGFEFVYRSGVLYHAPVVSENLPIFESGFELARPWNAESVLGFREQGYYEDLVALAEHPECGSCCFLDYCSRGSVKPLMDLLGRADCLTGLRNRWDLQLHRQD